ncbi:MAG: GAF domain-containing protein [Clostridiales bacterium]|nr:GAF domain-containing protein [Clostridiales bacterium]
MTEAQQALYTQMKQELAALMENVPEPLPNMANLSALIYQHMDRLNWAGFYINTGSELLLGPFQGKPACIRIPYERGVCGAAAKENRTQLVPDVHLFPGHIACDGASNSELVVPVRAGGRIVAVLDLDSPEKERFDQGDAEGMEEVARILGENCDWTSLI